MHSIADKKNADMTRTCDYLRILSGPLLAVLTTSCQGSNSHRLTLTGSSTVAPLAAEIGKRFEAIHPSSRIDVQTGGSSRGLADARNGTADIGMVSRALTADEKNLEAITIAIDGIAIIVHKSNPVKKLSNEQIRNIYTGKINNWRQIGGLDNPIVVINKAEGRSTLILFSEYFKLRVRDIKPSIIIGDNQQGILSVAGDPQAIGYVSIGAASQEARRGSEIRLLPLAGIAPSLENVRNGQYPLSRPLNLIIRAGVPAHVKAFLEFARSPQVHDLIEAQFFVSPKH